MSRRTGVVERRVAIFRQALGFQIAELSADHPPRASLATVSGPVLFSRRVLLSFVVGLIVGLGIALAVLR